MSFFSELKRRNVFRVAVLYVIASWVILQAADVLTDILPVPEWTGPFVFLLLLLGFPLVLIFSWVYEITPEGIKLEKEVRREESITHETARRLEVLIGILAVAAILIVIADRMIPERVPEAVVEAAVQGDAVPVAGPADNSIAVLPFLDMSESGDQVYFSDGLAEELLNLLAKLPELNVASRTSSFSFRDKQLDIPSIAAQLGVRYVLEGSVRKQDDHYRVTAQLIDAETNYHKWSNTYDTRQSNIFAVQDDIARSVVSGLQLVLSSESADLLARHSTDNIEAFEAYLMGRNYLRRPATAETLEAAERQFDEALQLDPRYADAYGGLCDTHLERYERSFDVSDFEAAEKACNRMLTLQPNSSAAMIALGHLYRNSGQYGLAEDNYRRAIATESSAADAYDGLAKTFQAQNRMQDALDAYQQAIDLQPGFWRGYLSMGNFLFNTGRSEEGIKFMREAVDLSPGNPRALNSLGTLLYMTGDFEAARTTWYRSLRIKSTPLAFFNLATASFFLRDFEQAAAFYKRAAELTPDDHQIWGALGDSYRFIPDGEAQAEDSYKKAIVLAEQSLVLNPEDALTLAMLAHYYAHIGENQKASSALQRAQQQSRDDMYVNYYSTLVAIRFGDIDSALEASRRAMANGYPRNFIIADAGMQSLVSDPRFQTTVQD